MHKFTWAIKAGCAALISLFSVISLAQSQSPVPDQGVDLVAPQSQPSSMAQGQDGTTTPVPILTGAAMWLTKVSGGQTQNEPWVIPVLLIPIGDKWLVESRADYYSTFANGTTTHEYGLQYAQVDYIPNKYMTLVAGRFISPFGIYQERLQPYWIRPLQQTPLTSSITSNYGLGGEVRGGFPAGTQSVNLNYAFSFSSNNTHHLLATNRTTGGRLGFFLPKYRLEIGGSFQQLLQGDHSHIAGLHAEWQPNALPLTLRSEFAHSSGIKGTAYWVESVYRLSQIRPLRRLELVARGQQVLADPKLTAKQVKQLGTLGEDTNQGDFGLNYYLGRDVRGSASYGRQFALGRDVNIWEMAITYRFITPLGKGGAL
jgi:hypothetical protein